LIRKLVEEDRACVEELLGKHVPLNLYMLGNLASLGFSNELSEFWGDFSESAGGDELRGVLNRYMTGWSVYGTPATHWEGLAAILDGYPVIATRLQDNPVGTQSFVPWLQRYLLERAEEQELMTLDGADFRPAVPRDELTVRPACWEDVPQLVKLYAEAGGMQRNQARIERPLRDSYFWVGIVDGQIVSAALTNAVAKGCAMIGGVFTHVAWRGRGISQTVCSGLCAALLADGLSPTLYWIQADAGHLYRKLGFRPIGKWRSVWLLPRAGVEGGSVKEEKEGN
jgi:uncharacterized protein